MAILLPCFYFLVNSSLLMNKNSIPSNTICKYSYSNYCDIFSIARLFCCVFPLTFFSIKQFLKTH